MLGYLQDFLFSPDRARTPVRALSGGERNRLLLARLFTRSFNVLVLDEPTNDLDIETLDLLEELLLDFSGTLLVVSHDRDFLDNVVTSTLVLEGDGRVGEYVGGYADWVRQRAVAGARPTPHEAVRAQPGVRAARERSDGSRFKEYERARGAAGSPSMRSERERDALYASLADPALLRDGTAVSNARARLTAIEVEVTAQLARWEELETIATG